ncbi:MAG: efflux RND transporter periplasmic adaptor subunit [Pseudomonadota bacterium]
MTRHLTFLTHPIAFILTVFLIIQPSYGQGRTTDVQTDLVRFEQLDSTVKILGTIVARKEVAITASVNGPIEKILVDIGDRVVKNQRIAIIKDDLLKANAQIQKANLDQALAAAETQEIRIALRQQEFERLKKLQGSVSFSLAKLEDKKKEVAAERSQLHEAKASILSARGNLKTAEINVARTKIVSPFQGVVTAKHIETGAYANVGTQIISMLDDYDIEIATDIPTHLIAGLKIGDQVNVVFSNGGQAQAKIRAFSASETLATRTRRVWFTPLNRDQWPQSVAVNQSVDIEIPESSNERQLTIHQDAVLVRGGSRIAFVVVDNQAQPRNLILGRTINGRFVVISGVNENEQVVTRGNERLQPGQSVNIKP